MRIKNLIIFAFFLAVSCKDNNSRRENGQVLQDNPTQSSPNVQEERPVTPNPVPDSSLNPTPGQVEENSLLKIGFTRKEIDNDFLKLKQVGFIFQDNFELDLKSLMDFRIKNRIIYSNFPWNEIETKIENLRNLVKSFIQEFRVHLSEEELAKWEMFLEKTDDHSFVLNAKSETNTYYDYCMERSNSPFYSAAIERTMQLIDNAISVGLSSCTSKERILLNKEELYFMDYKDPIDLSPLRGLYHGKLKNLTISKDMLSTDKTPMDLRPLKYLSGLKSLKIVGGIIENEEVVGNLSSLTYLELRYLGPKSVRSLQSLKNLQILDLSFNEISDLGFLEGMTSLKEVYLEGNRIKELTPVKDLVNLEKLNVHQNQITHVDALHAGHYYLHTLLLGHNLIEDVSSLKQLNNLRNLQLSNNRIKPDSSHCPTDTHIDDMNWYCKKLIDVNSR